jgi:uncharacterized protein YjbI with pentapeptide repeats
MANQEQLEILKQGVGIWNTWREKQFRIKIDLSEANLSEANLSDVDLNGANLHGADLSRADLRSANLAEANLSGARIMNANLSHAKLSWADLSYSYIREAKLFYADLSNADLSKANLHEADLSGAILHKADLSGAILYETKLASADLSGAILIKADLSRANLISANLSGANLSGANLFGANLTETNLNEADLTWANLESTSCIKTIFEEANMDNALIYGISVWNINKIGLKQNNLIITQYDEPVVTVDNLEVAQFIYLMLNNEKIRDVLGTIAKKGVLILGRFTPERKKILDAIREKLREHDFVPMMFDFEKVSSKDFTETIKILAGMSRFVIADISNPSSSPLELQATLPDYKIPFVPIIEAGQNPFAMFRDLTIYPWSLDVIQYDSEDNLMKHFQKGIIDRAMETEKKLFEQKGSTNPLRNISDFD